MDEMLTFDGFIRHWGEEKPADIALEQGERRLTWQDLERTTAKVVGMLAERGVTAEDRIAWLGKNSDLYFTLFYGAARAGVVMVPIGWRLAPAEAHYILADTTAKLLFTDTECSEDATKAAEGLDHRLEIIGADAARDAIASAKPIQFAAAGPDDAVLQLYTSGTTGRPKGAVLSNRNLFSLRLPGEQAGVPWAIWEDDEAILVCMPCAHIGGTGLGVMALSAGIRAVVQSEFNPDWVLDSFAHGVTRLFIVPAALQMVVQHPRAKTTDFSAVRFVLYGAAPIPLELLREAVETIPNAGFVQVYGMTETTGTVSALPPEDHTLEGNTRMRSAGKAVPGAKMKIAGEDGARLPDGEIGELLIKSPSNMLEYWNLPAETETALQGGWMHTGDAAFMDADGYVYIQDRIKDMIITGGENVYPAEVESAIYGHPSVAEVAVIGVPDEKWGEAVKACVVCKSGKTLDEAEVIDHARKQLAAYKLPKSVDVIAQMPRNASGKILRRELRAPYWKDRDRQIN